MGKGFRTIALLPTRNNMFYKTCMRSTEMIIINVYYMCQNYYRVVSLCSEIQTWSRITILNIEELSYDSTIFWV